MKYQDINSLTVDDWCRQGWEWGKPVTHEEYLAAVGGERKIFLTPTKPVPEKWFVPLKGAKVLGLASGGAQQIPLFCAAGAKCTVLDYSAEQCRSEREAAIREGYSVEILRADMTEPLPFPDECFDMVFHPVSNCYIEKVEPVFMECFRVLKRGGILLCGLDNGINFILDSAQREVVNSLPYNPLKDKSLFEEGLKRGEGVQFSHTAEEQIGGQLKAGFILTDIYEDTDREGNLADKNIPQYFATRAVKP